MSSKVTRSDAEWRALLTPLQYNVTRRKGGERAFTGAYLDRAEEGVYRCVCCGAALFSSRTKLDSRTGWPSFRSPIGAQEVRTREDYSWFRQRTEASCAACDAHLGYLLDDGAGPYYRIDSVALTFDASAGEPAGTSKRGAALSPIERKVRRTIPR